MVWDRDPTVRFCCLMQAARKTIEKMEVDVEMDREEIMEVDSDSYVEETEMDFEEYVKEIRWIWRKKTWRCIWMWLRKMKIRFWDEDQAQQQDRQVLAMPCPQAQWVPAARLGLGWVALRRNMVPWGALDSGGTSSTSSLPCTGFGAHKFCPRAWDMAPAI